MKSLQPFIYGPSASSNFLSTKIKTKKYVRSRWKDVAELAGLLIICRVFMRKILYLKAFSLHVNRWLHLKKKLLVTWSDTLVF
jgi:hypothetical protein